MATPERYRKSSKQLQAVKQSRRRFTKRVLNHAGRLTRLFEVSTRNIRLSMLTRQH